MKINSLKLNFIQNNNRYYANKSLYTVTNPVNHLQNDVFVKSSAANDVSFSGYNLDIRNHKGLPCAYCGETMLTKDDVDSLVSMHGKTIAFRLGKYAEQGRGNISPKYLEAINFVKQVASEYPDNTAAEILPAIYVRSRNKMILKQAQVYSRIEKLAQEVGSKELSEYISNVKMQDIPIPNDISIDDLSYFLVHKTNIKYRKEIINTILKITKEQSNRLNGDKWKRIFYEATTLPSSSNDSDALLVKLLSQALRHDPKGNNEIVSVDSDAAAIFYSNLLTEFMPTVEHLKPQSDNGSDNSSNLLAVHAHCNCKRSAIPFYEYTGKNSYMLHNISNYLAYISAANFSDAPNFDKIEYLKGINARLKEELAPISHKDEIKSYFNTLDAACFKDNTRLSCQNTNRSRDLVSKILMPLLSSRDGKSLNQSLDSLYDNIFSELKASVKSGYTGLISSLFDNSRVYAALAVKKYMKSDTLLSLSKPDAQKLNMVLSDHYIQSKSYVIEKQIKEHLSEGKNNDYEKLYANYVSAILPFDTPSAYCLKILCLSRRDDGTFDKNKILNYLHSFNLI